MGERLYVIVNVVYSSLCFVMGSFFLAFPTPQKKEMKNYQISLRVLAGAYFVMAILSSIVIIFKLNDNSREPMTFISLLVASSQALLFSFTLITLLNPCFVTQRYIFLQLLPIVVITLLYAFFASIFKDPYIPRFLDIFKQLSHPAVAVRILFFLFYIFQLIYYPYTFFREEKAYKEKTQDYFSENIYLQLSWVRYSFIAALLLGIASSISNFFPYQQYDIAFTISCMVFYFLFAIEFIKYPKIYKSAIQPVFTLSDPQNIHSTPHGETQKWSYYKNYILNEKYYLITGITIDGMAQHLNISRARLSRYINSEENKNFNTWVNFLRISDAQRLMNEKPELSFLQISEQLGYSEQTNFSRQFKIFTGISPTEWKQKKLLQKKEPV
jgi:AraC-like DNA-binding protein